PPPGMYSLSLHDALPIWLAGGDVGADFVVALELGLGAARPHDHAATAGELEHEHVGARQAAFGAIEIDDLLDAMPGDLGRRLGRSEEHTSELQSLAYLVC